VRRLRLFLRDLVSECLAVWGVARMRDCERRGGHRWGEPHGNDLFLVWAQECSRCHCSRSVARTTAGRVAVFSNTTVSG
jgi:hypothetical protein